MGAKLRKLIEAAIEAGASGIFFSCMGATSADFTRVEYERFGLPYDLHALEGAQKGWLNIVHVHADPDQSSDQIYFEAFTDYPVSVISWSDRITGPILSEALTLTVHYLLSALCKHIHFNHASKTD